MEDNKLIFHIFFEIMTYIGIMFLIPAAMAVFYHEIVPAIVFSLMGAIVFAASKYAQKRTKTEKTIKIEHAFVIVSLFWILAPLISSIPFMLVAGMNPVDSVFESVSAWTTTGFSMIKDLDAMPRTILFFRSLMQWVGGIGIIVVVLGGIFRVGGQALYFAEAREDIIKPNIVNTVKVIWRIYLLYTVLGIALFWLAGMPLFDSINHSMTALATGGMSTKNASIGYYESPLVNSIAILLMILGAISFSTHYSIMNGKTNKILKDNQTKLLLIVIFIAILITFTMFSMSSIFTIVSAITCTGFGISNIGMLPDYFKLLLVILMIIGGSAGSTAGGIKLLRFGIFLKSFFWYTRKILNPNSVFPMKIGGSLIKEEHVKSTFLFIIAYAMFFLIGSLVISSLGYPLNDAMLEVASAQGNVGLSVGIASPGLSIAGKICLCMNMLLGRLELWAFIIFFIHFFLRDVWTRF